MLERFSVSGAWWIPGEERQAVGEVTFDPATGISLSLSDYLYGSSDGKVTDDHPVFLGISPTGTAFTLVDCKNTGWSVSTPGLMRATYDASYLIRGHHFHRREDIAFQSVAVDFARLDTWLNLSGFNHVPRPVRALTKERAARDFSLHHKAFQEGPFQIEPGCALRVSAEVETAFESGTITLKETPLLILEFETPIALGPKLSEHVHALQLFLTLAMGQPTRLTRYLAEAPVVEMKENDEEAHVSADDETRHEEEGGRVWTDVEVFYVPTRRARDAKSGRATGEDMLFQYPAVRERFTSLISRWFECSTKYRDVHNLYAVDRLGAETYQSVHLLLLAQALEVYHRTKFGTHPLLSRPEAKAIRAVLKAAIPDGLPESVKELVAGRLAHIEDMRLYDRLYGLVERNAVALSDFGIDADAFAKFARDTRNYYTHYSRPISKPIPDRMDVFYLILEMRLIVDCSFLSDIGFEQEEIRQMVRGSLLYRKLLRRPKKYVAVVTVAVEEDE